MRGLASSDEREGSNDHVRVCADCRNAKTIRGVWYLVPGRGESPFVCETCFAHASPLRAVI